VAEKKFIQIPNGTIELGVIDVNLLIINEQRQLSIYSTAGSEITNSNREELLANTFKVFVKSNEYETYLLYAFERIERLVTSKFLSPDEKADIFFKIGEILIIAFNDNPLSKTYLDRYGRYIKSYIDLMLYSSEAASHLLDLSISADYKISHSINCCTFSMLIGRRLFGNSRIKLWELGMGGMLLDIGMTQVNPEILSKKSALTEKEISIIRKHSQTSQRIISKLMLPKQLQEMALYHHERYDGSGYPEKLAGKDIPFFARVAAVADVYDAITSDRSYKASKNQVLAIMEMYKDHKLFDPVILRALMEVVLKSEKLIVAFTKKHLKDVSVGEITDDYVREESSKIAKSSE
jgi:HD-GYP domain-containing protein (c-di-GMP phosphodiesterase class II)